MWNFIAFTFCLASVHSLPHTKELSQDLKVELDRQGEIINIKDFQIANERLKIGKKNILQKTNLNCP
jgi:hypothetical protein